MNSVLARSQLSVITSNCDAELPKLQAVFDHGVTVTGRCELEALFCHLLACNASVTPKTLDLIGHTTAGKQLAIGDWVIDASKAPVRAFFRELADLEVMPRLGIHAVRLLGCLTAKSGPARRTICTLSEILGIEVYGTCDLIHAAHYGATGFAHDELLACSSDLRRRVVELRRPSLAGTRILDLDALPARALEPKADPARPVRIASVDQTTSLLAHVDRRNGTAMPGLLVRPQCELALPSRRGDTYHLLEVLLDSELVRIYDDSGTGLVFAVADPYALEILVENLPRFG